MSSPARGVRFIHTAIRREIDSLEAAAWSSAIDADWHARATFLAEVVHLHTSGEEQSTFADLTARLPDASHPYLLDHAIERELFARAIETTDADERRRAMSALARHVHTHIQKEEELVIPLLERLFTIPELGAQAGRMMATFPPAKMAEIVPWMYARLDDDDRVAYSQLVVSLMPPDRLPGFVGWVKRGLDADGFARLVARVPALTP